MRYNCFALATTILLNWLFRGRILKMMHKLNKCDSLLAGVHLKINAKYQRRCVLRLMTLVIGLTLLVTIFTAAAAFFFYDDYANIMVVFWLLVYITLSIHLSVSSVVCRIGAILFRLRALNSGLYTDFLRCDDREMKGNRAFLKEITIRVPNEIAQLVHRYADIQHYLCDIVDLCNRCFSFQVS